MFPSTPSAPPILAGAPGSLDKGMNALSLDAKVPGNGCRADTSVDDSEQQAVALERCSFCALLDRDGCGMCGCEFVERCVRERVVGVGFFGHFSPAVPAPALRAEDNRAASRPRRGVAGCAGWAPSGCADRCHIDCARFRCSSLFTFLRC